jgi:hypothetical protein
MHTPEVDSEMHDKKTALGIAMARGQSVAAWARQNGVAERTAHNWSNERIVREACDQWRRRVLNQAIGRMVRRSNKAVDGIERLAQEAESESVRLSAWRAILGDQMTLAKFSSLEHRMKELEETQKAAKGAT